jgi:hypothetical protein
MIACAGLPVIAASHHQRLQLTGRQGLLLAAMRGQVPRRELDVGMREDRGFIGSRVVVSGGHLGEELKCRDICRRSSTPPRLS